VGIRAAEPADLRTVADTLARAFLNDPIFVWVFPEEEGRLEKMVHFFTAGMEPIIVSQGGRLEMTDGGDGAALWAAPGHWADAVPPLPDREPPAPVVDAVGLRKLGVLFETLHAHHPTDAHWYLEGIGVRPDRQGEGVGSSLIAAGLRRADAASVPAYLETQNPTNIPLYERHGFEVVGEMDIPLDGPHMWRMWRPSAAAC
jgi:ribosomal protein S18 acetylase RimI-like enzyme